MNSHQRRIHLRDVEKRLLEDRPVTGNEFMIAFRKGGHQWRRELVLKLLDARGGDLADRIRMLSTSQLFAIRNIVTPGSIPVVPPMSYNDLANAITEYLLTPEVTT